MRRTDPLSNSAVMTALAGVACLLWASAAPMIKIGYSLLSLDVADTAAIIIFAGCRFTLAGVIVLLFRALSGRCIPKAEPLSAVKLGLVQTYGQYVLYYLGVARASAVNVSVLNGTSYLWAIILACYLFRRERMTFTKAAACVCGFAGLIIMNLGGAAGRFSVGGEGLVIISTVMSGIAAGLTKRYTAGSDAVALTGWQFFAGGLMMIGTGVVMGGRLRFDSLAACGVLAYLGCLSAVAYTLWNVLIKHNDISRVSVCGFMNPLFGVFVSAALLGEFDRALRPQVLIALALVCAAVIAVNRRGKENT